MTYVPQTEAENKQQDIDNIEILVLLEIAVTNRQLYISHDTLTDAEVTKLKAKFMHKHKVSSYTYLIEQLNRLVRR